MPASSFTHVARAHVDPFKFACTTLRQVRRNQSRNFPGTTLRFTPVLVPGRPGVLTKNLFKMAKVVAKPPLNVKIKNITANPPTATPPKAVVSKAVVNPVFQTVQTFADNYRKTAGDRKIYPIKYKVFTGVYTTDRVIANAWRKYQALPDANKKTYFT